MNRSLPIALGALLVLLSTVGAADAFRYQPRPDWFVGVGWGMGRGEFTNNDGIPSEYRNGGAPAIRLGKMLSPHFALSANWNQWIIEFGNPPLKVRRSLQSLGLGLTLFPGDQLGPLNGVFLRVGGGLGWAGTGAKEAIEGEEQHTGERIDEWGVAVTGEGGYEFWVAHNFTAGVMATATYLSIDEEIVKEGWFSAIVLNGNLYF